MTPAEDSQQSGEQLSSEESTAHVPSNSVHIRVRDVPELNNNNEAEASSSTSNPIKRRCLPSWMFSDQGSSTNKIRKEESEQNPESTLTSPSTSKVKLENENNEVESSIKNSHLNEETDENSKIQSSGDIEHGQVEEPKNGDKLYEQMEIDSSTKNDEVDGNSKAVSSPAAEAGETSEAQIEASISSASTSNQTPASSKVTIKAEPNDDDGEVVGQVTATNPNDIKPAVKIEKEEATSSTTRVSCRYGIRCYRQNPMHRREEAHPGDTDYQRPNYPSPPTDVPQCPYGNLCYRRNPTHFQAYSHPPSTDFKQNWKIHKMRLRDRKQNQGQLSTTNSDFSDDDDDFFDDSSEEFKFEDEVDDEDDY